MHRAANSKHALCTRNFPLLPFHPLYRHPTSHRQCLECALRPMVIIGPLDHIDVQRHPRVLSPAVQAMVDHFCA